MKTDLPTAIETDVRVREGAEPIRDGVDAWLDVFTRLLRLPESESGAIRDELEGHLRDRVNDLLVSGVTEHDATRQAIEELGDAAILAQRFKEASKSPKRRWLMNLAVIGAAGAALTLSLATFTSQSSVSPARQAPPVAANVYEEPLLESLNTPVTLDGSETWSEFFDMIRDATGGTMTDWNDYANLPIGHDDEVGFSANGAPISDVLEQMNAQFRRGFYDELVLVPMQHGGVHITSRSAHDQRTITLVSYDIAAAVDQIGADEYQGGDVMAKSALREDVAGLIMRFVEPDHWIDNGGDLAQMSIVGDTLFIEAPARFLPRIEWILAQLAEGQAPAIREGEQARGGGGR